MIFDLFLELSFMYKNNKRKEPSVLSHLAKILIISLHLENCLGGEEGHLIQYIINNFEKLTDLLDSDKDQPQIFMKGMEESVKLGVHRLLVIKLLIHAFLVDYKKFNLYVSMSELGKLLLKQSKVFKENDRFVMVLYDLFAVVLRTEHKALIENIISKETVEQLLDTFGKTKGFNKLVMLKFLKMFDAEFEGITEELAQDEELSVEVAVTEERAHLRLEAKKEETAKQKICELEKPEKDPLSKLIDSENSPTKKTPNETETDLREDNIAQKSEKSETKSNQAESEIIFNVRQEILQELLKQEDFQKIRKELYKNLRPEIKIYVNLETEIQNRNNRKTSSSSVFSNNLVDDLYNYNLDSDPDRINELLGSDVIKNMRTLESDDPGNDFSIDLVGEYQGVARRVDLGNEEYEEELETERESFGLGVIRRRKISEDNIKVGGRRFQGIKSHDNA